MTAGQVSVPRLKALVRKFQIAAKKSGHEVGKPDAYERRLRLQGQIALYAHDGFVTIVQTGRDCDGYRIYYRRVVPAISTVVELELNRAERHADGPYSLYLDRPSGDEIHHMLVDRDLDQEECSE